MRKMNRIEILEKCWDATIDRLPKEYHQKAEVTYWKLNTMLLFLFSDVMTVISPSFTSDLSMTWFLRFGESQSLFLALWLDTEEWHIVGNGMDFEIGCYSDEIYDNLVEVRKLVKTPTNPCLPIKTHEQ